MRDLGTTPADIMNEQRRLVSTLRRDKAATHEAYVTACAERDAALSALTALRERHRDVLDAVYTLLMDDEAEAAERGEAAAFLTDCYDDAAPLRAALAGEADDDQEESE